MARTFVGRLQENALLPSAGLRNLLLPLSQGSRLLPSPYGSWHQHIEMVLFGFAALSPLPAQQRRKSLGFRVF